MVQNRTPELTAHLQAELIAYLQVELVAGVTPIELGALDPELPVRGVRGAPVAVAELPQHLLIAEHAVYTCRCEGRDSSGTGKGTLLRQYTTNQLLTEHTELSRMIWT